MTNHNKSVFQYFLNTFSTLVGRLSVSRKLMLIYILDLTAVIFITSILIEEKFIAIDFARKELVGITYISTTREVMHEIVAINDGKDKSGVAAIRNALQQAENTNGKEMDTRKLASELDADLAKLADTNTTHAASHDAFLTVRKLVRRIGDQSNLILDPDLDSYYAMSLTILRFPELLEELINYNSLTISGNKAQYLIAQGRLDALIDGIDSDYQAAYAGNPSHSLPSELDATRISLLAALHDLSSVEVSNSAQLAEMRDVAIKNTLAAWQTTSISLDKLLQARIHNLFKRMWLHLGMAASLLVLILSFVFYVARQIALPLRRLALVADRVQSTNDYSLRANWSSGDEIGQLFTGFNSMLERLDSERLIQQELTAQRRASEAQRELIEAIPIPLLVTSVPEHHVLHANNAAAEWVDIGLDDPWGKGLDRKSRTRFFQRLADEESVHEFEARWNGPNGQTWALLSATLLQYQGHDAVLTTFAPINKIKRLEAGLRLWANIFEATSEGILVLGPDNMILQANAAIARATGYRIDEMVGQDGNFISGTKDTADVQSNFVGLVGQNGSWQGEVWLKNKSGEESPQWLALNTIRDEQGVPSHIIALFVDITERMEQEEKIRHLAHHDALTGLPNRLLFDERLRMSLEQAARHNQRVALLYIDLDRFKNINDSLGHHVGDGLLQSVAQRLSEAIRGGDTVCRQGGDEFVVILNDVVDVKEVAQIVERRLIPLILKTHHVCDIVLHISCSVGIAVFPEDASSIEELMRNADAAMYTAKTQGRNNFQFFSAQMNSYALERLNTETHLQQALVNKEFELHVQPIVDCKTGALISVEALLRWRQPDMGMIPPAQFIPIAEENGLIHDIGRWVLVEACRLHHYWLEVGLGHIPIAVNVSAVQFMRGDFDSTVAAVLEESGMPASYLQIELTESLMMTDSESKLKQINGLRALGIGLSLDDFGTGYSSLSYLTRLPLDKLKIDRSFISDMLADSGDMAITRAVAGLGRTLGLRVVAEGVEHAEELKVLQTIGCDEVQGYLISRPLPAHEFSAWLNRFQEETWS